MAQGHVAALDAVHLEFDNGFVHEGEEPVYRPDDRALAVATVAASLRDAGLDVHRIATSALPGPSGNVEFFIWASRTWQASDGGRNRPPALDDAEVP